MHPAVQEPTKLSQSTTFIGLTTLRGDRSFPPLPFSQKRYLHVGQKARNPEQQLGQFQIPQWSTKIKSLCAKLSEMERFTLALSIFPVFPGRSSGYAFHPVDPHGRSARWAFEALDIQDLLLAVPFSAVEAGSSVEGW